MNGILLIAAALLLFFGVGALARKSEKKAYNNGICKECGSKLYHFDNDSQGGRGYVCNNCNYVIWVSYPWVDN